MRACELVGRGRWASPNQLEDHFTPETTFTDRRLTHQLPRKATDNEDVPCVCNPRPRHGVLCLSLHYILCTYISPPLSFLFHNRFTCGLLAWTSCLYLPSSHSHSSLCNLTSTPCRYLLASINQGSSLWYCLAISLLQTPRPVILLVEFTRAPAISPWTTQA